MEHFEKSVQKTQGWIKDVMYCLELDSPHKAFEILKMTLLTLRDRLPLELVVKLGAQLPILLRGIYYEGWKPSKTPIRMKNKDDFIEIFKTHNQRFEMRQNASLDEWDDMIKGVFVVVRSHISPGEMKKIANALPDSFLDWLEPTS